MLDAVGIEGMSDEETDEVVGREKKLASVPVRWINPALTEVFHVLDDWREVKDGESFQQACGNRELPRGTKCKSPMTLKPIRCLPQNWYDVKWYRSLNDGTGKMLEGLEDHAIPSLVSCVIFCFSLSHYHHSQL